MKKVFIFLLLATQLAFSQDYKKSLLGSWIKVKMEMKDSSRVIRRFVSDSTYINYIFKQNEIELHGDPIERYRPSTFNYLINGKHIVISEYSKLLIEKITVDTLIISEDNNFPDDKSVRYYLIREKKINRNQKLSATIR